MLRPACPSSTVGPKPHCHSEPPWITAKEWGDHVRAVQSFSDKGSVILTAAMMERLCDDLREFEEKLDPTGTEGVREESQRLRAIVGAAARVALDQRPMVLPPPRVDPRPPESKGERRP
jgi:hypothetical protein